MKILVRKAKNKNVLVLFKNVLFYTIMITMTLLSNKTFSQSERVSTTNIEARLNNGSAEVEYKRYTKNVNPSIFVQNNNLKKVDSNALCLFTDVASLSNLQQLVQHKSSVEYIAVKISNPSQVLNPIQLAAFSSFSNLKVVHFIFEYEISNTEMRSKVVGSNFLFRIAYESRKIM